MELIVLLSTNQNWVILFSVLYVHLKQILVRRSFVTKQIMTVGDVWFLCKLAYNGDVDKPAESHVYINPKYKTVIVAGSAGSRERLSNWTHAPDYMSAKYIYDYG